MRVLLTGGAGFIGHHTVTHFLKETDWEIIVMDRLSYAGNLNFLTDLDVWDPKRVKFIYHDFRAPVSETTINLIGKVDYIVHMGAESHVDRSIDDPLPFAHSNVIGTINMLNYARKVEPKMFIYISTDEVYGPADMKDGRLVTHKEGEAHRPSNPYSASKSGGEAFCYSYWNTYDMPIIITNTMNNFGERQNREKFLPRVMRAAIHGEPLKAHCRKDDQGTIVDVSSRCWLHARNHADGLLFVMRNGESGERYNITGDWLPVDKLAFKVGDIVGSKIDLTYEDFHSFRPGHDMHYGLDGGKLEKMGWKPPLNLDETLEKTVRWTMQNQQWL